MGNTNPRPQTTFQFGNPPPQTITPLFGNATTDNTTNITTNITTNNTTAARSQTNTPLLEECIAQLTPKSNDNGEIMHVEIMLRGAIRALGETMHIVETSAETSTNIDPCGHATPMEHFAHPDWDNVSVVSYF